MTLAWICLGLIVGTPDSGPAADYKEARAKAGRSPDEQVKLALWCEAHGLTAERLHHLTLAVLADPANAAARGLMGLVAYQGRWRRPEVVAEKLKADPDRAATLADYEQRRQKAAYTADAQWALGIWASEHGLPEQAKAHLTAVIRLDPSREQAWKKLGYQKHDGRWVTDAQLAAEKAEAEAQKSADRKWKPLLEKSKAMLGKPSKREEADAALAEITDPRAVPMIGRVFATTEATQPLAARLLGQIDSPGSSKALAFLAIYAKSAEARQAATETLRGRDAREYADLLIALLRDPIKYEVRPVGGPGSPGALFVQGPKVNVQRLYSPPPTFRPGDTLMIDPSGLALVDRTYGSYSTGLPNVTGHSRYIVASEGYADDNQVWVDMGTLRNAASTMASNLDFTVQQDGSSAAAFLWQAVATGHMPNLPAQPGRNQTAPSRGYRLGIDTSAAVALGFNNLMNSSPSYYDLQSEVDIPLAQVLMESSKTAQAAQEQLKADVAIIEGLNRATRDRNDKVLGVLKKATGQNLEPDRQAWTKWWVDQVGYAFVTDQTAEKPTIVEEVPLDYQPVLTPVHEMTHLVTYARLSCFGAGTPVRTVDGVRAIESLQVGDLVLTQSTDTGALGYKPILVTHHNPPSSTFRIKLGGESIISSHFHRFWLAGRGWVMARDLKPGDPVRTLGGVAPVESIEPDQVQPVYNLDVAEDADFFAGNVAALVHDNTLPDPRLAPFDVEVKVAVAKVRSAD